MAAVEENNLHSSPPVSYVISKAVSGQRKRREREKLDKGTKLPFDHQIHPCLGRSSLISMATVEENNLHSSPPVTEFFRDVPPSFGSSFTNRISSYHGGSSSHLAAIGMPNILSPTSPIINSQPERFERCTRRQLAQRNRQRQRRLASVSTSTTVKQLVNRPPIDSRVHVLPERHFLGFNVTCSFCSAVHWNDEKLTLSSARKILFRKCCSQRKVNLPPLITPLPPLQALNDGVGNQSTSFQNNIRQYNVANALAPKDPLLIWKETKQSGFLSSSQHGGIPKPEQQGRKGKDELMKKNMEIAKKEEVDKFAKMSAPSGLLSKLNPGIITNVRNMKQVRSIIQSLVRSERIEKDDVKSKQGSELKIGRKGDSVIDMDKENMNLSTLQQSVPQENESSKCLSECRQTAGQQMRMNQPISSYMEERNGGAAVRIFYCNPAPGKEDDILALKLSSSTAKASQNVSSLSSTENLGSASSGLNLYIVQHNNPPIY